MSSSMRNAIQRRNHRERAQPTSRSRLGLLEKHSDYALRAADHRDKKKRIKILREKARDRNPDEFNFGMMRAQQGKDGVRIGDRGNVALKHDTVKLLKTQDEGYLRTVLGRTRREVERVVGSLKVRGDGAGIDVLGDDSWKRGRKTVFVDSLDEQNSYRQQKPDDDDSEVNGEDVSGEESESSMPDTSKPSRTKARQKEQRKLEALKTRQRELLLAQRELDLQRAKMNNSIGGINKNGVKFKIRERKR